MFVDLFDVTTPHHSTTAAADIGGVRWNSPTNCSLYHCWFEVISGAVKYPGLD